MNCHRCGLENPAEFHYCGYCGVSLRVICAACGAALPVGSQGAYAFCGYCGAAMPGSTVQAPRLSEAEGARLGRFLSSAQVENLRDLAGLQSEEVLAQAVSELGGLLNATLNHLPPFLSEQIWRNPELGAGGQFLQGALLFSDISGFTAMSERLSQSGREGAEEITAIVNGYFETMLEIVRAWGGQCVQFGGDALLALFLEPPPESSGRALSAALEMQAAMSHFSETRTSQGVFPLQMKIAVHCGRFFAARLGDASAMKYALLGEDVNATALLAAEAQAGQVLSDAATLQALGERVQAAALPGKAQIYQVRALQHTFASAPVFLPSWTAPAAPTLNDIRQALRLLETLTAYLPDGLVKRLSGGQAQGAWGEHRLVAVLFCNVHGLGSLADRLGPGAEHEIVRALNRYYLSMNEAIRQVGGIVNKIDLYEHGDKLMVLFGAPSAHEDDAERAIRAAVQMQANLKRIAWLPGVDLSQSIGLSFGYVYAGFVGAAWRHEYTVMGDRVNLAARLMSAAGQGEILIGPDMKRKIQALAELNEEGEIFLKGKRAPVPTYTIRNLRKVPEPLRGLQGVSSPLVGRAEEWQAMRQAAELFLSGRGQVVCISGAAGMGKSRLTAELAAFLRQQPAIRWVEGRCLSYTTTLSYYPFREVVRGLLGLFNESTPDEIWSRLHQTAAEEPQTAGGLPYLAHFLDLPLSGEMAERVQALDGEALQRRTFLAIRALIEALANRRPLVLVLDDLHWADQASTALLEYLMPLVNQKLFLVLVYRLDPDTPGWQIQEKASRDFRHCLSTFNLNRLDPAQSEALLKHLMPIHAWPDNLGEILLRQAEGNPLYLEEMVRSLRDSGALVQDDAGWRLTHPVETLAIPDTLEGVIMTRLDRLEEVHRRASQESAVIGRSFEFDLIKDLLRETETQTLDTMSRLQQAEIVYEAQRQPALTYTFQHGLVHEVCYASLLSSRRRQTHQMIARLLERQLALEASSATDALIAHHAYHGQDWALALKYLMTSGEHARQVFANADAVGHFERALECLGHLDPAQTQAERLECALALGELLTLTGKYEAARQNLELAFEQAAATTEQRARICRWRARLHEQCGEFPLAFEWGERGLEILQGQPTAEAAQLHALIGLLHVRKGNRDIAWTHTEQAIQIAEALGESATLARSHSLRGFLFYDRGDIPAATQHYQIAFDLHQRAGNLHGQATALNLMGNAASAGGQRAAADRFYRQAREIFAQINDVYQTALVENNLGVFAAQRGRPDEALAFYAAASAGFEQINASSYAQGTVHMNTGAAWILKGDTRQARAALERSEAAFNLSGGRNFLPELKRYFAEAALADGDTAQAEAFARESLALSHEMEIEDEEACTQRVLGQIAACQGDFPTARSLLENSAGQLECLHSHYEAGRSRLALAEVCWQSGDPAAALAALEACQPIFMEIEADRELAVVAALRQKLAPAA